MGVDVLSFETPDGIAHLSAGQLQKRRVLLRMLVQQAPSLEADYRYVRSVPALLDYPHLGVWIVHCLRRTSSDIPLWADLGYLGWLTAAHRIRSGWEGQIDVVVRDGVVMLPGLGLARLAPAGIHGIGSLSVSGGLSRLSLGDSRVVLAEGDPNWLPLRTLDGRIHLDDIDPFRDLSDPYAKAQLESSPPRLSAAEAATWSANFIEARSLLHEHFPDYAAGIERVLRSVVPLTAGPIANGVSNTSLYAFGGVNMSAAAGPHQFALTLIHECQHTKLSALTDMVELQKPSTVKDLYAPWRDDPRPLSGLLQGIYAHIGVTDFWRVYRTFADSKSLMANIEFARWRSQVIRALGIATASPLLTDEGRAFVAALSSSTARWADSSVPGDLEALAEECSIGHYVAWRVRNINPGGIPKSSRSRLPVGYVKMTGATSDIPASDNAYVDGRYSDALALYLEEPESPSKWAGIALCLRHLGPSSAVTEVLEQADVVAGLRALTAQHDSP